LEKSRVKKKTYAALFILLTTAPLFSAVKKGERLPDHIVKNMSGKKINLRSIKTKVLLLDIWSLSCAPCRLYMKKYQQLHKKYAAKGLKVVALSITDDKKLIRKFFKKNGFTYTSLMDTGGWQSKTIINFSGRSLPRVLLVDNQGIIRFAGHPAFFPMKLLKKLLSKK